MKILIAGLLAIVTAGFTPGAVAEKVKLTGEQLTKMLAELYVHAGVSTFGYVLVVVSEPGGKRELYWNREGESGVWQGQAHVEGDQICSTYTQRADSPPSLQRYLQT